MNGFRIGELSRLTGFPSGTIRFYEKMGLIPEPPRTPSGYRKYPADSLERLHAVRRIKDLGFSLGEISELMRMLDERMRPCKDSHCRAAAKLRELDQRIGELQRIKTSLQELLHGCEGNGHRCTLLESIAPAMGLGGILAGAAEE